MGSWGSGVKKNGNPALRAAAAALKYGMGRFWKWQENQVVLRRAKGIGNKAESMQVNRQVVSLSAGRSTQMYVRGTEGRSQGKQGRNYMCGEAVALVTGGAAESSPL